jgi:hypothetical protein
MIPNFLIIGAARCGTTSLHYYLKQHPQIYMSPIKEPGFFAFKGEKLYFQGHKGLFKWPAGIITNLIKYQKLFEGVSNEIAIGESSTSYIYVPITAKRIKYYIPEIKLIVILRNPVERAFSHFLQFRSLGIEPVSDFTEVLQAEDYRICNNWHPYFHYKHRGFYYKQLKKYYDLFKKNQIRIYLYKDWSKDPINILKDIFEFLGVENNFVPNVSKKYNPKKINIFLKSNLITNIIKYFPERFRRIVFTLLYKINIGKKPQLLQKVRNQLIEEYRADILKLEKLINQDLSHWLK